MARTVYIDEPALRLMLDSLLDSETMRQAHECFARRCDPYVPFRTGDLSRSGTEHVTPEGVIYTVPYAERQYYGVELRHNPTYHPKATALWDEAMFREQEEAFTKELEELLNRRAEELYGK